MKKEEINEFVVSISSAKRAELNIHFRDLTISLQNEEEYNRNFHREGVKREKAKQRSIIQNINKLIEIYKKEKSFINFQTLGNYALVGGFGMVIGYWLSHNGARKVNLVHGDLLKDLARKGSCIILKFK